MVFQFSAEKFFDLKESQVKDMTKVIIYHLEVAIKL